MKALGMNNFARTRHTKYSPYSYFTGSEIELLAIVAREFKNGRQGYKEGVWLVGVPPERFRTGVVMVGPDTPLRAEFKVRREGEEPYVQVFAVNATDSKAQAKVVDVVLYSNAVLGDDATDDAEWEVVSINARETEQEEPPTPMAMARNMLNLPGGTKAEYSADEFARSIAYWSQRVMCG